MKKGITKLDRMPERIPVNGTFELTVRCNLKCKMCMFRHDDSENEDIRRHELSAGQWIDMAGQAARAGTLSLLITGGEPMLRPDFCEIWEGIYRHGFITELYTNATLVTPEIMETLKACPPHRIGVTLYGASPETYGEVCGNAGAFDRAIEGMHMLSTLPSRMSFRTTIIRDNYPDIDRMEELVSREFGETRLTYARIVTNAVRGACADVKACRLEPEDNVRMAYHRGISLIKEYVGDRYDEKNLRIEYQPDPGRTSGTRATLFGCNGGMEDYAISWKGQLLACQMMDLFRTDALGKGFEQAWADFPGVVKVPPVNSKCAHCDSQTLCNCCIASRLAETGDPGGWPAYVCADTQIVSHMLKEGGLK